MTPTVNVRISLQNKYYDGISIHRVNYSITNLIISIFQCRLNEVFPAEELLNDLAVMKNCLSK